MKNIIYVVNIKDLIGLCFIVALLLFVAIVYVYDKFKNRRPK